MSEAESVRLGERIHDCRVSAGMSYREAGECSGVSAETAKFEEERYLAWRDSNSLYLALKDAAVSLGYDNGRLVNRAFNLLRRLGAESIGFLGECDYSQLIEMRNMGKKTISVIMTAKQQYEAR